MRKLLLITCTVLLLLACSVTDFIPRQVPASTPTPTSSPTVSNTPTITLTPTRTITPTPHYTATLIISEFNTQVVLVTDVFEPEGNSPSSPSVPFAPVEPSGGFESVELSKGHIYYGVCKDNYTKMTIKVEDPGQVRRVYLFFRLESGKKPGDTTKWYGTVTSNDGGGYFLYTMRANNIPERKNFLKAWVQYQFVAEDANGEIVGRSPIFPRNLLLEPCQ